VSAQFRVNVFNGIAEVSLGCMVSEMFNKTAATLINVRSIVNNEIPRCLYIATDTAFTIDLHAKRLYEDDYFNIA
jgi:hypothetical protein